MDAHLVAVPGLGTLTARGLAGGDLEGLGGQADGALEAQVLALGALDDLGADLLENLDLAGGQGDADLVALLRAGCQSSHVAGTCPGQAWNWGRGAYGSLALVLLRLLVGRHF